MSELLIPAVIAQAGRWSSIVHAAKVVVDAVGILLGGKPAPAAEFPGAVLQCLKGISYSGNVLEVAQDSIVVVKLGNDHFPMFDDGYYKTAETKLQALLDEQGIKARVWVVNHTADFTVLSPPLVETRCDVSAVGSPVTA